MKYGNRIGYALAPLINGLCLLVHSIQPAATSVEFVLLILAIAVPAWFSGFRAGMAGLLGTIVVIVLIIGWPIKQTDHEAIVLFYTVAVIVFFGFSTMGRNIRQALSRAMRSEQLIDLASDALLVRDLTLTGTIRFWNTGAEHMYGYSSSEAIGRPVGELLRTEYPLENKELIEFVAANKSWEGELVQRRKDGTKLTVHSRWTVEPSMNRALEINSLSVLEMNRDITIEKALEEERRLRFQAESNVRARDDFLAIAAHELKTPLTSLSGFAQLLQREMQAETPDRVRVARALHAITEQTSRLVRLTNQLLDVSRITLGKAILKPERVDLADFIRDGVTKARLRWPDRKFHYQGSTGGVIVEADPGRIDQVFINLIENACKFSEDSIEVGVERVGDTARICVRDYGRGVPPDLRESIFERSVQADPRNANSGLGLGLFICREIVQLHGGTIYFESPPDDQPGSRFVIELPLRVGNDG